MTRPGLPPIFMTSVDHPGNWTSLELQSDGSFAARGEFQLSDPLQYSAVSVVLRTDSSTVAARLEISSRSFIALEYVFSDSVTLDPGPVASVRDVVPPRLESCPEDDTVITESGPVAFDYSWSRPLATDKSGNVTITVTVADALGDSVILPLSTEPGNESTSVKASKAPYTFIIAAADADRNMATCSFQLAIELRSLAKRVDYVMARNHTLGQRVERTAMHDLFSKSLLHVDAGPTALPTLDGNGQAFNHIELVLTTPPGQGLIVSRSDNFLSQVFFQADLLFQVPGTFIPATLFSHVDATSFARLHTRSHNGTLSELRTLPTTLYVSNDVVMIKLSSEVLTASLEFVEIVLDVFLPRVYSLGNMSLAPTSNVAFVKRVVHKSSQSLAQDMLFFAFADVEAPTFDTAICNTSLSITTLPQVDYGLYNASFPGYSDNFNDAFPSVLVDSSVVSIGDEDVSIQLTLAQSPAAVTFTVRDGAGNVGECVVTVAILDREPPAASCPEPVFAYSLSANSSQVQVLANTFVPSSARDNSGVDPDIHLHSGSQLLVQGGLANFRMGSHTVVAIMSDLAGNVANCTMTVMVSDPVPPVFIQACPSNQRIETTGDSAMAFWQVPFAQDNSGLPVITTNTHEPGDVFPIGLNRVVYTATDQAGNAVRCSFNITLQVPVAAAPVTASSGLSRAATAGLVSGVAIFCIGLATLFVILLRQARRKVPADFQHILDELNLLEDEDGLRQPKELSRDTIRIVTTIGEGNFGTVDKAMYTERSGPAFLVAVKRLHAHASSAARQEILEEAAIMAQFSNPCVVALVGVVTKGDPILAVLEYMEQGALLAFLRKHAHTDIVDDYQRLRWCLDLANGLEYLHRRRFVHRDVAARNVLLDSHLNAKIADFGMTREGADNDSEAYYRARKGGAVPVRWTAPEALEQARFSTATDVWAYGVTAWEIFTNGTSPYQGMTNQKVWTEVVSNYRMPCPEACPTDVYQHCMLACWATDPEQRPSMMQTVVVLDKLILPQVNDAVARAPTLRRISKDNAYRAELELAATATATAEHSGDSRYQYMQDLKGEYFRASDAGFSNTANTKETAIDSVSSTVTGLITSAGGNPYHLGSVLKPEISSVGAGATASADPVVYDLGDLPASGYRYDGGRDGQATIADQMDFLELDFDGDSSDDVQAERASASLSGPADFGFEA